MWKVYVFTLRLQNYKTIYVYVNILDYLPHKIDPLAIFQCKHKILCINTCETNFGMTPIPAHHKLTTQTM